MNLNNTIYLKITKLFTYTGAILVAVYVALLGLFKIEPPGFMFYTALFFVGIGVIVGNVLVFIEMKNRNKKPDSE